MARKTLALSILLLAFSCGGSVSTGPTIDQEETAEPFIAAHEDPPLGKLPEDVSPKRYEVALRVVPSEERFSGIANVLVELEEPRNVIWMHGRDLAVSSVTVTPAGGETIEASWEQVDDEGVVAVRLESVAQPGDAMIHVEYDAPFNRQLEGLYRVDTADESYAFTQMEAISARRCIPSFDEPRFKVPFDFTLEVRADHVAAANTQAVSEQETSDGMKRVRFATTEPMPTYLIAFAVGPLEVVEADPIPPNDVRRRPLPFRGLAVQGQGERLAYALRETPALLEELESYFGSEYPYDKLDIVAVPDFGAGAMENVGLVTFREWLLLVDEEEAEESQKRAFAGVMAHELAHMWFGDLVTMPWWNDIWLNEAFATWMASKVVRARHPDYQADVGQLVRVQGAMGPDSLTTARRIRQPIESNHDIRNAFDAITYSKGGGVLEMFERWMGVDTFREGIRLYMQQHRFGTATAEDLLAALGEAAGRDVATPFSTFLNQPGVPVVSVELSCEDDVRELRLAQSRYLPVGSEGDRDQFWQIPVCARYPVDGEVRQTCDLLTQREGVLVLEGDACPDWVMPNADGAGYFRFTMESPQLEALRTRGWSELTGRERLAFADSLSAGFDSASMSAEDVLAAVAPLARDEIRHVAIAPMDVIRFLRRRVLDGEEKERLDAWGRRLYQPTYRRLRWEPRRGREEDGETALLRANVIEFLAMTVEDPAVRREAARRGRAYVGYGGDGEIHPDAVDPNLADVALAVAVQEGDAELFDALLDKLVASSDATLRTRLLGALAKADDEELSARAIALALDERLRVNEMFTPIMSQMGMAETRERAWTYLREHFDAFVERAGPGRAGYTPFAATSFCDAERVAEMQGFFGPRVDDLPGGPRNLATALEAMRLCAARVEAQRESAEHFFSRRR
jgi:alanyl aminopeptidase